MITVQVGADVENPQGDIKLRATSRQLLSSGYLAVYATKFFQGSSAEDSEDTVAASRDNVLSELKVREDLLSIPVQAQSCDTTWNAAKVYLSVIGLLMQAGDKPQLSTITPQQHFTKPPAHFNEASAVKALEEQGIGRPSTYASIVRLLQVLTPKGYHSAL